MLLPSTANVANGTKTVIGDTNDDIYLLILV